MARSLVLVDDVLVRDRIDRARRALKDSLRRCLVASVDRLLYVLDRRAQFGAQARVVLAAFLALSGPLSG